MFFIHLEVKYLAQCKQKWLEKRAVETYREYFEKLELDIGFVLD